MWINSDGIVVVPRIVSLKTIKGIVVSLWVWMFRAHKTLTHFTPWCPSKVPMVDLVKKFQYFHWLSMVQCSSWSSNQLLLNESKCCWNVHYVYVHCGLLLVLITLMFIVVLCFVHHLNVCFYPLQVFIMVLCWCSLF